MGFVHRCHFCGWQRDSRSPTILEPTCERCGCLLVSGKPEEFAPERRVELRLGGPLHLPRPAGHALRLGAFASVLLAAGTTGFQAGGVWMGVGAMGAAGLAATQVLVRG